MKMWHAVAMSAAVGFGALAPAMAVAGSHGVGSYDVQGPCFLELVCPNGSSISCSGAWACSYSPEAGWISCDGAGTSCGGDQW